MTMPGGNNEYTSRNMALTRRFTRFRSTACRATFLDTTHAKPDRDLPGTTPMARVIYGPETRLFICRRVKSCRESL